MLQELRSLGERLDAFRKEVLAKDEKATLTGLYNALERRQVALSGGGDLTQDEREAQTRLRTALLAELHDDIDRAVLAAYGWSDLAEALVGKPGGTTPSAHKSAEQEAAEDALLARLVTLNQERAAEEARGLVRWLRPDYQISKLGHKVPESGEASQIEAEMAVAAPQGLNWPAEPREQFGAVRDVLSEAGEALGPEAVARAFKGRLTPKRRARVEEVLAILADMGVVRAGERGEARLYAARR